MTTAADSERLMHVIASHERGLSDALTIVQQRFRSGSMPSAMNTVVYGHEESVPALTLCFDRRGHLAQVDAGPGLRDGDVEGLVQSLTAPREERVWASVVFAYLPTRGTWRYRDVFQILPVPAEAPEPEQLIGDHPFLLEVAYEGHPDPFVDGRRASITTREIVRLLAGLVLGPEDRTGHFHRKEWVLESEVDDGQVHLSTRFAQLGYVIDDHRPKRESFTAPGISTARLRLVEPREYLGSARGISVESELELPANIELLLDRYFDRGSTDQERFQRWAHWLNHATQVWSLSPSAAHIAVVQAIEALMPAGAGADRCDACGQPAGPGPTQRFAEFLAEYAPGPAREKARKELYALRSSLTHGGKLLSGEIAGPAFHDFTPQAWDQREMLDVTRTLARIAGVNWLLAPSIGGSRR